MNTSGGLEHGGAHLAKSGVNAQMDLMSLVIIIDLWSKMLRANECELESEPGYKRQTDL